MDTTMISFTYGVLPTREQFDTAFERECPNGYRIQLNSSDSRAVDGYRLGDGTYTASELWDCILEIVIASIGMRYRFIVVCDKNVAWRKDAAMDIVSSVLYTLGFEWI
jgi:hypothetical protein